MHLNVIYFHIFMFIYFCLQLYIWIIPSWIQNNFYWSLLLRFILWVGIYFFGMSNVDRMHQFLNWGVTQIVGSGKRGYNKKEKETRKMLNHKESDNTLLNAPSSSSRNCNTHLLQIICYFKWQFWTTFKWILPI